MNIYDAQKLIGCSEDEPICFTITGAASGWRTSTHVSHYGASREEREGWVGYDGKGERRAAWWAWHDEQIASGKMSEAAMAEKISLNLQALTELYKKYDKEQNAWANERRLQLEKEQ